MHGNSFDTTNRHMRKSEGYSASSNKKPQTKQNHMEHEIVKATNKSRRQIRRERKWMEDQLNENDSRLAQLERRISSIKSKVSSSS